MATFYDSLPLNVIKQVIKAELMESTKATECAIESMEFDDEIYGYDEDPKLQELNQQLTVVATLKGDAPQFSKEYGTHPWLMEWSADMAQFTSLCRMDQDDDKLPADEN